MLTIYLEFFQENKANLVVEILNDTSVFDVKENVNELKVFYGDVDIKSLNKKLSVLLLKVKNGGGAPILNGYYDDKYPLAITLEEGTFLKTEQISATNKYLKSSALPIVDTEKRILLPKIILEQDESYTIKILTLHSAESDVNLNILGKIAGIRNIRISKNKESEAEISYLDKVFSGNIWVQLLRLPTYFLGLILSLGLMIIPTVFLSGFFTKRQRKKIVQQFKTYDKSDITDIHKLTFETYIQHGIADITEARNILSNRSDLEKLVKLKGSREPIRGISSTAHAHIVDSHGYNLKIVYKFLTSTGGFSKDEDEKVIPNHFVSSVLDKFIGFVDVKES